MSTVVFSIEVVDSLAIDFTQRSFSLWFMWSMPAFIALESHMARNGSVSKAFRQP